MTRDSTNVLFASDRVREESGVGGVEIEGEDVDGGFADEADLALRGGTAERG